MSVGAVVAMILAAVVGVPFLLGWWARGWRDRRHWRTKPATDEQIAYLRALAAKVGTRDQAIMVNFALNRGMTRAEASALIHELKQVERVREPPLRPGGLGG